MSSGPLVSLTGMRVDKAQPTWGEVAYRLWRRGYTPEQIADFLKLEGWRLNGEQVGALVHERGGREARQWAGERLADGPEGPTA